MIVGTVREVKTGENRVGLVPSGVGMLAKAGHEVLVESGAGKNSGFDDGDYSAQGAKVVGSAAEVWNRADMVVKVKEPVKSEYSFLRKGLVLFTYLHLAAEPELARVLLEKQVTGIAYETVELDDRSKPLLSPMSEVAGRMSVQVGMHYLERTNGGAGRLLAGVPGVSPCTVTIIGSGVAGTNAAKMANGLGARVVVIGIDANELRRVDNMFHGDVATLYSSPLSISSAVAQSDLIIGSVAVTGASAPKLVTREMLRKMRPGSVVVDISIDQGGCFETSRPTTHANPTYVEEGIIHYCVTNMPGAVPYTSTLALANATTPYVLKLANMGFGQAARSDRHLAGGVNTWSGKLTNKAVAESLKIKYEQLSL